MKEAHSIEVHITDTYQYYCYKTLILLVLQAQYHQTTSQAFESRLIDEKTVQHQPIATIDCRSLLCFSTSSRNRLFSWMKRYISLAVSTAHCLGSLGWFTVGPKVKGWGAWRVRKNTILRCCIGWDIPQRMMSVTTRTIIMFSTSTCIFSPTFHCGSEILMYG